MTYTYLAKREETVVDGEVVEVRLLLFQDATTIQVKDGDAFFTVETKVPMFD